MGKGEGWGEGSGDGGGQSGNDWDHGLLGCCKSPLHCVCGIFLPCCQICKTAHDFGESGCLYSLLSFITPCIPILLLRSKVRDRYGIPGSTLGDVCASVLCPCCASIQVANEVDQRT